MVLKRTGRLSPMSTKRREALGGHPSSTFAPKRPQLKTSAKQARPHPAVPADVRTALQERSSGWCEAQLEGCWAIATDPHHRITRKRGGRHGEAKERSDRLSSLIYVCRPCHDYAHQPMSITRPMGLRIKEHENPMQEPVLYRGEPKYLDDAGGVHSYEAHCA